MERATVSLELNEQIPAGLRIISVATGIRWIGWGMIEPLLPVFLFSLVKSYGVSGLFDSVGQIVFLLVLPIAGIFADRISLKIFLIGGLFFFFLDGLWSVAAITSLVIFAFFANLFDGIAVASDVVGRATYIRQHAIGGRVASSMGFQNSLLNAGMLIGASISFVLIRFVSLPWIFFGVIPTNLVAIILLAYYLPDNSPPPQQRDASTEFSFTNYWGVWKHIAKSRNGLRFLAGLTLFVNMLSAFNVLLIPIYAYIHGANLQEIILLGGIGIVPYLFSSPLGKIADRWGLKIFPLGLLAASVIIAALSLPAAYSFLLAAVLMLQTILVLLGLVLENFVTARSEPEHFGRISAVVEGLKDIGGFMGAIGLGFAVDYLGVRIVFLPLSICAVGASILFYKYFIPKLDSKQIIPRA